MTKADPDLRAPQVAALLEEFARRHARHQRLVEQFLEEAGGSPRSALEWRSFVGDTGGTAGVERWKVAVDLARESPASEVPTIDELHLAWEGVESRAERRALLLLGRSGRDLDLVADSLVAKVEEILKPLDQELVGSVKWRALAHVLAHRPDREVELLTVSEAERLVAQFLNERAEDEERKRGCARELACEVADVAVAYVASVWEVTGEGPTWLELSQFLGVRPRSLQAYVIEELVAMGRLHSSGQYRSLKVAAPAV